MPMLVPLIELMLLCLVLSFFITQIIMPYLSGHPMFPILRRRTRLESKMRKAREKYDETVMEGQINMEKGQVEALRGVINRSRRN